MANEVRKCGKCAGSGTLSWASHIENGRCFACDGAGTVTIDTIRTLGKIPADMRVKCDWILTTDKTGTTLSWSQLCRLSNFAHTYVMNPACADYYGDSVINAYNDKFRAEFNRRQNERWQPTVWA
jgi:hypothetical protein